MGEVLLSLLPLVIGAGVVPVLIIMVLLLLSGKNGLLIATMFVAGMTVVRLGQGLLFGFVLGSSNDADSGSGDPSTVVSVLLLVIAVLMYLTAAKLFFKEDDPDAPPPKWMGMIQGMSPGKALGIGAAVILLMAKQWVFTLSALATISEAGLGTTESVIAFLIFVLLVESFMIIPIAGVATMPEKVNPWLAKMNTWLKEHNDPIVIAISLIFGTLFMYQSLSALL